MLYIKLKAREIIKGNIIKMNMLLICPALLMLLSLCCFSYPLMSLFYESREIFGDVLSGRYIKTAAAAILIIAGIILFISCAGIKFYTEARFFYLADKSARIPRSILSFPGCLRYIRYCFLISGIKLMWAAVFFSPALITAACTYLHLLKYGIITDIFTVLIMFILLEAAAGAVFYKIMCAAYYMCPYILYLNPLQKVREVISSSVLLTKGKTKNIILMNINILPWKYAALLILPLPFILCYIKSIKACMCISLYAENGENKDISPPALSVT